MYAMPLAEEGTVLRLVGQISFAATMLLSTFTARADPWVAQYTKALPEEERACAQHELAACRQRLLELETLLDGRQDVIYKLARIEAQLGLTDSAQRRLDIYARSGLELGDPSREAAFAEMKKRGQLDRVIRAYQAGQAAQTAHERIATLRDPDLVAEDIVCDRADGSFLISSVRKRKILRLSATGETSDFVTQTTPPLWGVFALGLDSPHHVLWATTATLPVSPPFAAQDADHSALLAFEANSGALLGRYTVSRGDKHSFGDLTVAPSGTVYVSDGVGGGVYTIASAKGPKLEALVEPGALGSPQTPALTADGSRLFVPDYVRGIAIVNPTTRAVSWLKHPPELALFGIDGLYLEGRTLVAIQNGTAPERIIMLRLNDTFDRVVSWRVLLARAPGLGDPTHGCLYPGEFSFIANSGWNQFRDDGERDPKVTSEPAEIWKVRVPQTLSSDAPAPPDTGGKPINPGSWRMPAPQGIVRWLVVHKAPSEGDEAFHVEVLQRKSGDPAWKFEWLARHLAITDAALRQSILGPVRRSEPYPETYESAYKAWQAAAASGDTVICRTTVMRCLQS